ncbi:hypothetical protein FGO68_gene8583 [Halteria grandinella]|uniref:Uncharacterized protein n=1 Tax=Halteria grandinella TaxID=5974 RepID=A0A8J8T3N7_HALGN|nr:hypothetical protein FGO68_gene8583 [Halteria grandinella]
MSGSQLDIFSLSTAHNLLLVFDCPSKDREAYSKFSEEILNQVGEAAICFFDTEIPAAFPTSLPNVHSIYELSSVWLLLGVFSGQANKHVHIFTDDPEQFIPKFQNPEQPGKLRQNVAIHPCIEAQTFSVQQATNPWVSIFDNQEVLSSFEISQLQQILRKFIKQSVTSKTPNNLEKLINISQNLVKAHMSSIKNDRTKMTGDLAFHFVRSLFLDNVLENKTITLAILSNDVQCMADFENFTKINYTSRFQSIIDKLKAQIKIKQEEAQLYQLEKLALVNEQAKADETIVVEDDETIIKGAIQHLFDQYVALFTKAKIFEIRKLNKLMKQINNYVSGFIMKKETAPKMQNKDRHQASVLKANERLICSNLLKIVTSRGLIKSSDMMTIDHEPQRINELNHNDAMRQIKEAEYFLENEQANQIYDQPSLVFKKPEEPAVLAEPEEKKKGDPIDLFIERLYMQIKSSKHFPNSLRELAKIIRQKITMRGEQKGGAGEEVKNVEDILRRMHDKGMFTKKMRTGESKEHAKEHVKLKFSDIIELFKREDKEDIGIVFESQFMFQQPANSSAQK